MNNKATVDDWRIRLLIPLLWLFDLILRERAIASAIFERVRRRYCCSSVYYVIVYELRLNVKPIMSCCREYLRNILLSVYGDKDSVDEDLVEV